MTEQHHDSAIAKQLLEAASLHVQLAQVMAEIAKLADERNFLLRRDMQHNYETAIKEAQELFAQLSADVARLHAIAQTLPEAARRQLEAIEDDLAHIKRILAGPEADDAGGG